MMRNAMPAHGMTCSRAASKAESVAGVVLIANVVRAATKVGARDKTSEPSRRNSSIVGMIRGGDEITVEFFRNRFELGGDFIIRL
jgi:hypothetical protein